MQFFKLHGNNACVCIRALGVGVGGPTRLALKDSIELPPHNYIYDNQLSGARNTSEMLNSIGYYYCHVY